MSNLKIKDKIIKLGNRYGLSSSAMILLDSMIVDSNRGFLQHFQNHELKYKKFFPGGLDGYFAAFQELSDGNFIQRDIQDDSVFIKPFLGSCFYGILGVVEGRKRKYSKQSDRIKKDHDAYLARYGSKMNFEPELSGEQLMRYNTKTHGVKIPETLMPFFTGEPLPDTLNYDNEIIVLEKDRRNLTKEEKRIYYACMKFADSNGIIDDYNEKSLINSILLEFGDGSVCQATVYLAVGKLLNLKLVRVDVNSRTGSPCLVVVGYKEAFERRDRYVIIPDVVLEQAFKRCQTSTIKAFFKVAFMLNNGDGGTSKSDSGQDKRVRLSFRKYLPGRNKNKQKEEREDWLKKRYKGEVCSIVWGDISDSDIHSLSYFFHITLDDKDGDLSYYFRMRSVFYISKTADLFKSSLALVGKNLRRAQIIEESFRKHGLSSCSQEDLLDLVRIFRRAGRKNIDTVIGLLADRIHTGKEKGWRDIDTIPGYVRTVLKGIKEELEPPNFLPEPVPS